MLGGDNPIMSPTTWIAASAGRKAKSCRAVGSVPLCLALLAGAGGCAAPTPDATGLTRLFNGRDLAGWEVLKDIFYDRAGKVFVRNGELILAAGEELTGIRWKGEFPTDDFEISLEAKRVVGGDFFCGMTFPVEKSHATLILGGWGGSVVGISNVDGYSASENDTATAVEFKNNRWYRIVVLVTDGHLDVWIDDRKLVEMETEGRKFNVWPQQEDARPFGITTFCTTGALRNITLRRL